MAHSAEHHRQTDDSMTPIADHTVCSSMTDWLKT